MVKLVAKIGLKFKADWNFAKKNNLNAYKLANFSAMHFKPSIFFNRIIPPSL